MENNVKFYLLRRYIETKDFNLFVHQAAKDEHLDVVKFLIKECEVDVNQTDDVGYTPLQLAAKKGHINVVKCLTNHGADVNPKDDKYGCSALHHASFKGYTSIVKWLVQQCGADVNSKENLYGWTPLLFASSNNHLELVKFLVRECRPDITEKDLGNTPLINSCQKGHLEVVKCLVKDGGADVNLKNNTKQTPLDIAQLSGKMEIVRYLQNCKDALGQRQSSAIGSFSNGDHYGDFFSNETDEIKCQLKAMGEDVHLKNYNGETILHKASFIGRFEIVKFLIEDCKALVNVMTFAGRRTPLHFAAFGGHLNVVKFLVNESEANVNQKDGKKGRTPLHYASKKGHLEVVKCLVNDGGADVNLKDANDNTSLRLAYLNNHIGVVIFLYD